MSNDNAYNQSQMGVVDNRSEAQRQSEEMNNGNNTQNPLYGGHNGQTVRDEAAATQSSNNDDDDMFSDDQPSEATTLQQIDVLARHIAYEMDGCDKAKKALTERNGKLDSSKEDLCRIMKEAGMDSCKLACGLTPSASYKPQYYAVDGCSGDGTLAWLRGEVLDVRQFVDVLYAADVAIASYTGMLDWQPVGISGLCSLWPELADQFKAAGPGLADIIKPTVNFNTLNSSLKEYEQQGNVVPDSIATKSMKPAIRMNGKSKFLAAQAGK